MTLFIIIGVIAIILVIAMNIQVEDPHKEESKGSDFDIDPKIEDFGMDPADVEPTPIAPKPKKKYKRKPKTNKPIQ